MPISDRLSSLQTQLRAYRDFDQKAVVAEKFRERATELRELRTQLQTSISRARVLQNTSTLSAPELAPLRKLPEPSKALESTVLANEKLASAPLSLNEGRDYATLRSRVERCANEVAQAVSKTLDVVKQGIPSVDEAFLKQVETIPAYEARVREIREKRNELLKGLDLATADAAGIAAFLERRTALRELTDGLDPAEFPKDVLSFFRAARGKGADVDAFTESVRRWLEERDLLKKVRIVLST